MKYIIHFVSIIILVGIFQQPLSAQENRNWSAGTAYTIPQGRRETGLFQPLRNATTNTREWIIKPIIFPVFPNIAYKQQLQQWRGGQLSYKLGFQYPTLLLRMIRKEGTGGILAPDPTIPQMPHMLRMRYELLYSKPFSEAILLTYKAGIAGAINGQDADTRTTIDLPVIYPRMAVYYNGLQFNGGIDALLRISSNLTILVDGELFWTPGYDYPIALENKLAATWHKSETFAFQFGFQHSLGEYPFGKQQHLIPIFDLIWVKKPKK
ncbi:hypothetical protein ACFL6E_00995 [Candidatus Neomarinimicrobiota bacterium]